MKRCNRSTFAIFVVLSLCVAAFAVREGLGSVGQRTTDTVSEEQAVSDAHQIFLGNHTWGIVKYAHYPNGPSYLLLPAIKLGLAESKDLRVVPVIIAGLSFGVLCFGLLVSGRSLVVSPLVVGFVIALLYQPGVLMWMGALHEHSYALSMCFFATGMSLLPKVGAKTIFCLSFISGWIGYDFTFCFLFAVATCRWLVHLRSTCSARSVFLKTLRDFTVSVFGVGAAVVAHVVQNTVALGGLKVALRDLLGSAAARAGLPVAASLNPDYDKFIQAAHGGKPYARTQLIADLAEQFWSPSWIDPLLLRDAFICLLAALSVGLLTRTVQILAARAKISTLLLAITLCFLSLVPIFLAAVAWLVVMPDHARFHFHFIQRHFFVPIALLGVVAIECIGRCWDLSVGTTKARSEPEDSIKPPCAA